MVMLKFGGAAGVSYLCHGSGCSEVPGARMHSTSEHLRYLLLFFFFFSIFSYPLTFFPPLTPPPCLLEPFSVWQPPPPCSLKAERK